MHIRDQELNVNGLNTILVTAMVKHHGYRTKSRSIIRKNVRDRGLKSLRRFLINYKVGDKVDIIGDPAYQKRGFPHRRFHGKTGTVIEKRGQSYMIEVRDGGSKKQIIARPEHLKPQLQ